MGAGVRSVVDIGSNSIKLRVARCPAGRIEVLLDTTEVVRLGRRTADGRLRREAIRNGARVVEEMVRRSREMGAEPCLVGTMALRVAENAQDFLREILGRTGLEVRILSGEEEARLAWRGALDGSDGGSFAVFDTGGGSTEFVFGASPGGATRSESVAVGAVSLTERFFAADPPAPESLDLALRYVRDLLLCSKIEWADPSRPPSVIGLGGGVVAMASVKLGLPGFAPLRLNGMELTRGDVEGQMRRYAAATLEARRRIRGLPASRADLVLASSCIVLCALEALGAGSFTVSINGLRHGLLVQMFESDGLLHSDGLPRPCAAASPSGAGSGGEDDCERKAAK
ncbi:Ppx/GppA family phosphatase [uncultured Fretibacterium sp.]|uniref:Ppx/GppA phosphatase family protein n=1 Tax=uncultured Fretibacterium sp. TaxID=1678694 RepID=UPI0026120FA2|nr:Ppx/GppA family phosphatase [uncultured Fretibacterium sp.]